MANGSLRKIKCPTCGKAGAWFSGRFGPFCSERCKLVDLGRWFNEDIRISEPLRPDHFLDEEHPSSEEKPDQPEKDERT